MAGREAACPCAPLWPLAQWTDREEGGAAGRAAGGFIAPARARPTGSACRAADHDGKSTPRRADAANGHGYSGPPPFPRLACGLQPQRRGSLLRPLPCLGKRCADSARTGCRILAFPAASRQCLCPGRTAPTRGRPFTAEHQPRGPAPLDNQGGPAQGIRSGAGH